jgi:RNA polymerase sigma factor (TIGR02999 family)
MGDQEEITVILQEVTDGSTEAYNALFPLIYDQLLDIAQMRMQREEQDHTYSRTDLVHEAYLHLVNMKGVTCQDRAHFFAIASRCMRQVLIDHARKKKAEKRGGNRKPATYLDEIMEVEQQADKLVNLDEALKRLSELNKRLAEVVECRYFGEMTIDDTACALGISESTVKRDWRKARGWLYKELKGSFV